jgi:hypothetical protein
MEYDNTNRGVLFTNKKKNEKQPDFTGQINIEGKTSAKGTEFTSLSVREPYVKETKASETKDDIPW